MKTRHLSYSQNVHEVPREYPKTNIKKPIAAPAFAIIVDDNRNSITLHVIVPLYRGNPAPKQEIDVIHFAVDNTLLVEPLQNLTYYDVEGILKESSKIAIDKTNEALQRKYPKVKKLPYCSLAELKRTWDDVATANKPLDPSLGAFVNPPFGVA